MNPPPTLRRRLTVLNSDGIYARPAARIVKTCAQAGADTHITFENNGYKVPGKSILALLTLDAWQGTELTLTATGPKAREVIEALTDLFNRGFDTGEPCLPIPPEHGEFVDLLK